MKHLDKYGDFVNENIFKKWFSTSDEEKRKMGYVENDEGDLVHPDDIKKSEQVKKNKIDEVKSLFNEKYKDYDIKWVDDLGKPLSFEFDYKKDLGDLIKDPKKDFTFNDKEYSLDNLIKSFSVKITIHKNDPGYWESRGLVKYVQITQKMELSDDVNFTDCFLNTRGHTDVTIKRKDNKFYLYITKFVDINYDLTDEDTIKSWKSGSFVDYTIEEQFEINTILLVEAIKKSFTDLERKVKADKIKENIDYIKECFYEISDVSKSSKVEVDNYGTINAFFEIKGVKIIRQSETVQTGSRRSGTAYFNKAKFKINDTILEFFSMLSVAKARIEDKIPNCEVDTEITDDFIKIYIK